MIIGEGISIYFRCRDRRPDNVMAAWHGAPEALQVGDEADLGEGFKVRIIRRRWFNNGRSIDCEFVDLEPVPTQPTEGGNNG